MSYGPNCFCNAQCAFTGRSSDYLSIFKTLSLLACVCTTLRIEFTEICKIGQMNCAVKTPISFH